ncbi:Rieske 2Fe-2S domain-containing protein [bacterium]|nr:Rieske 2Fe-2S domain-containing protein [bacterium]
MFVSQTHLPQLLDTSHYSDEGVHQRERETMFQSGWHCLAAWDQFPKEGDYITSNLLGTPLILWRRQDQIRAFLNVCTHRFSMLTDRPTGCFQKNMKCQYHGWEYDETGNTCRIPDAQSFRPLKKGELGLKEYRVEMVGQLVFVTLNPQAPPLREYLGEDLASLCEERFSKQHHITYWFDREQPCNWKIVIENLLESYHIENVHPRTFKRFPVPEHCTHTFHDTYDYYIHDFKDEPDSANTERFVCHLTGQPLDLKWRHILRYPNIAVGGSGPFYYFLIVFPLTPTTCRLLTYTFHYSGPRGRLWPFLVHRVLKRYGKYLGQQINQEDAAIYPGIQIGNTTQERPHGGGLISAREERIFAFQKYILSQVGRQPAQQTVAEQNGCHSETACEESASNL